MSIRHAIDVLGVESESSVMDWRRLASAACSGIVGMLIWKKQPELGLLAGTATGYSVAALVTGASGEGKREAIETLGAVALATYGAHAWEKRPLHGTFVGIFAGSVGGSILAEIVK